MTRITTKRDSKREERIVRVLGYVPRAELEPNGVTAYTIHRRTGLTLQSVLGSLDCLVRRGEVTRIPVGGDTGSRYVVERDQPEPVPDAALSPVELYRLEKQRRRDRLRADGIALDATPEHFETARRLLAEDAEHRHGKNDGGRNATKTKSETIGQDEPRTTKRVSRSEAQPAEAYGERENQAAQATHRHSVEQGA